MHMQSTMRGMTLGLAVSILTLGTMTRAETPDNRASAEANFKVVEGHLQKGGDLFVIANVEGAIESVVNSISETITTLAPADDPDAANIVAVMKRAQTFLKDNGFYALQGFGLSIVPRADALFDTRLFIRRTEAAAMQPLWQAFGGGTPRALRGSGFLGSDAVVVRTGTADGKALWSLIRQGIQQVAPPEVGMKMEMSLSMGSSMIETNIEALIASLGTEGVFAISLSSQTNVSIPDDRGGQITFPAPSLLIAVEVQDDSILTTIRNQTTKKGQPLAVRSAAGTDIYSITLPAETPFPIQLSLAQHGGFLLITIETGLTAMEQAMVSFKGGKSFATLAPFKDLYGKVPEEHNGILFVSPRMMETIESIQTQALGSMSGEDEQAKAMRNAMKKIFGASGSHATAMVIRNLPEGILVEGVSSEGSRNLVAGMSMAPIGILAGIAIPSFVKARSEARNHSCINNLRIMDAAKEQSAMERGWSNGQVIAPDSEEETNILAYIKGNMLPSCPQGGTYSVNPIGVNPTCTIPGHSL